MFLSQCQFRFPCPPLQSSCLVLMLIWVGVNHSPVFCGKRFLSHRQFRFPCPPPQVSCLVLMLISVSVIPVCCGKRLLFHIRSLDSLCYLPFIGSSFSSNGAITSTVTQVVLTVTTISRTIHHPQTESKKYCLTRWGIYRKLRIWCLPLPATKKCFTWTWILQVSCLVLMLISVSVIPVCSGRRLLFLH
jgi:hypothetical protein